MSQTASDKKTPIIIEDSSESSETSEDIEMSEASETSEDIETPEVIKVVPEASETSEDMETQEVMEKMSEASETSVAMEAPEDLKETSEGSETSVAMEAPEDIKETSEGSETSVAMEAPEDIKETSEGLELNEPNVKTEPETASLIDGAEANALETSKDPSPQTQAQKVPIVKWRKIQNYTGHIPKARHGHRAVCIKELIVIYGGGNGGLFDELHVFNTGNSLMSYMYLIQVIV